MRVDGRVVGAHSPDGLVFGSYVHGLFLHDAFRRQFFERIGLPLSSEINYQQSVEQALDDLAQALEQHLDVDALLEFAKAN